MSLSSLPNDIVNFEIYSETSLNGLGYMVMQHSRVIDYASHQLKLHEVNYPTNGLELVAIVFTLKSSITISMEKRIDSLSTTNVSSTSSPKRTLISDNGDG